MSYEEEKVHQTFTGNLCMYQKKKKVVTSKYFPAGFLYTKPAFSQPWNHLYSPSNATIRTCIVGFLFPFFVCFFKLAELGNAYHIHTSLADHFHGLGRSKAQGSVLQQYTSRCGACCVAFLYSWVDAEIPPPFRAFIPEYTKSPAYYLFKGTRALKAKAELKTPNRWVERIILSVALNNI